MSGGWSVGTCLSASRNRSDHARPPLSVNPKPRCARSPPARVDPERRPFGCSARFRVAGFLLVDSTEVALSLRGLGVGFGDPPAALSLTSSPSRRSLGAGEERFITQPPSRPKIPTSHRAHHAPPYPVSVTRTRRRPTSTASAGRPRRANSRPRCGPTIDHRAMVQPGRPGRGSSPSSATGRRSAGTDEAPRGPRDGWSTSGRNQVSRRIGSILATTAQARRLAEPLVRSLRTHTQHRSDLSP